MQTALIVLVGLTFASAIYLLLKKHLVRMLIGIVLFGNAVNLSILAAGRVGPIAPPIVPATADTLPPLTANPLPQALILTAIVISFAFFAFLLVLSYRAYEDLGTDSTERMRFAEPEDEGLPPLGY